MSITAVLASEPLRKRPVFLPQFGEFLSNLRDSRGWTLRGAASLASRRGLKALTYQVMFRLESGQTKSPDAETLRAVADLYEIDYPIIVERFTTESYGVGRDLPLHGRTRKEDSQQQGESHDPASPRVQPEVTRKALEEGIDSVIRHLTELSATYLEDSKARRSKARGGRRDRKAS